MGFSSIDNFISQSSSDSKFWRTDWNKLTHGTTAQVAAEWYCLFHSSGNPMAATLTGATNLSFQSCCDQTTGSMLNGGICSPATKHIINASAFTAAATVAPCVLMLVDILGFYLMTSTTTTGDQATVHAVTFTADAGTDILTHTGYDIASFTRVQFTTTTTLPAGLSLLTDYYTVRQSSSTSKVATSMANAIAGTTVDITDTGSGTHTVTTYLPRYTNGDGVQCFVTPAVVMGAATPNLRITYTNSNNANGRLTPSTLPVGKTASPVGHICYSGVAAAGKFGPFMPLQANDSGIKSIQQLNLSVSYVSGTLCYFLCKPLLYIPITTQNVAIERDFINQVPSMPQVMDNACLAWLNYAGANTPTTSAIYGHLDFAWGS